MTWNSTQPLPTQLISQGQATILNNFAFLGSTTGNVTPGFYKLPNGLILQWGTISMNAAGNKSQTYPVAFSTIVYHLSYSLAFDSAAVALTFNAAVGVCVDRNGGTLSLTSAVFRQSANPPGATPTLYWFAIGK
jgi:hypothetical protein